MPAQQAIAKVEAGQMTPAEADKSQQWAGMGGAIAFQLIARHADGLGEVCDMMEAWQRANSPAAPEDWRHIANEYADGMVNGIQWLKNIRDGISSPITAVPEMEENFHRIGLLAAATRLSNNRESETQAGLSVTDDAQSEGKCS